MTEGCFTFGELFPVDINSRGFWFPPSVGFDPFEVFRFHRGRRYSMAELFDRFGDPLPRDVVAELRLSRLEVSARLKREILWRDPGRCQSCSVAHPHMDIHHIRPVRLGGTNEPLNLLTLCFPCHMEVEANRLECPSA